MKVIGIVGSRRRNSLRDYDAVRVMFTKLADAGDTLVSGGCPHGADNFAEQFAVEFNIPIKIYKADWKLGKHAGFLRNTDIARDADVLIACVAPDRKGGTEDTIKKFQKFHPEGKLYLV